MKETLKKQEQIIEGQQESLNVLTQRLGELSGIVSHLVTVFSLLHRKGVFTDGDIEQERNRILDKTKENSTENTF